MKISKRGRIYLLFLRWFSGLPETPEIFSGAVWIFKSIWQAFWLGFLDTEDLNGITWSYYMSKSGFESEDFNIHEGLWAWETDAFRNHFQDCERVLIAGAGGGREVIALARLGFEVTAFDFSPYLTAACRRNLEKAGCSALVLDAPPDGLPEGLGVYDAVLIGRGFYHHIPGRKRRVAFLRTCLESLKVDDPIILSDFFTREAGSSFYPRTQAIANYFRRLRGQSERIELGDWLTNCTQHAFTRDEIEEEFFEAGINLEIFTVSPFSADPRLAHILGRTA